MEGWWVAGWGVEEEGEEDHTMLPTSRFSPSFDQVRYVRSPPTEIVCTQLLVLTSQNRTVPSREHVASSASRVGWKATRSTLLV